jgi:hypothetical protein
MAAQDLAHSKAWGGVTTDLLKRLDMNVDFAAMDWTNFAPESSSYVRCQQAGQQTPSLANRVLPIECTEPMRLQTTIDQTLIRGLVTASTDVRLGASQCLERGRR